MRPHIHLHLPGVSLPAIRQIGWDRPFSWLMAGLDDLKANPLPSLAYGLLFALVSVSNRATTRGLHPAQAALWQNISILLCSLPLAWSLLPTVRALDWLWIALLGLLCTALAHSLFVASLRVLKARTTSVIFALEPVYGIAFAWWLFHEQPSLRMLGGGALIVLATLLSARLSKHSPSVDDLS